LGAEAGYLKAVCLGFVAYVTKLPKTWYAGLAFRGSICAGQAAPIYGGPGVSDSAENRSKKGPTISSQTAFTDPVCSPYTGGPSSDPSGQTQRETTTGSSTWSARLPFGATGAARRARRRSGGVLGPSSASSFFGGRRIGSHRSGVSRRPQTLEKDGCGEQACGEGGC